MDKNTLDQLKIDRPPERESDGSKWGVLVLTAVIALAAAGAGWFFLSGNRDVTEVRLATIREIRPEVASTVLNASGYVTARRAATVSSKVTGKVTEVLIEEGMTVEEGQVVARLDDSNLRKSMELAQAQLLSARAGLTETEVLLDESRVNFERNVSLEARDLASEQELDRSRALMRSLEAQLNRKQADVEVASRSVAIYQQQLDDTIIRAPFAGVVISKNAQPGEMISPVSAGGGFTRTGIGTVVDMSSLEIEIDVNESYIARVEPGQPVMATLDAYPDWRIPCYVIAIIPTADRQRATVEVRVGFNELDPRILPDMGVKVAFQEVDTGGSQVSDRPVVLAPQAAIGSNGDQDTVFIYNNGMVERRAVSLGDERGRDIIVQSGLGAGDRVVLDPPPDLVDGARVKEREES